jgi:hypothetical protein
VIVVATGQNNADGRLLRRRPCVRLRFHSRSRGRNDA